MAGDSIMRLPAATIDDALAKVASETGVSVEDLTLSVTIQQVADSSGASDMVRSPKNLFVPRASSPRTIVSLVSTAVVDILSG